MIKRELSEQSEIPDDESALITPLSGPAWPEYHFDDGLRKVRPYHFTFNTYAKQRWLGRRILDVYQAEFRDRPHAYYKNAFVTGQIVVNGKPIPEAELESRLVYNADLVTHTLHRHEPPVSDKAIGIVYEDDELMAIDKPAGIPVHPAGRYRFNSITEILRSEHEGLNPLPCNRLDRLTSGIMFIGKTPRGAQKFSVQLSKREVRKEYVARVLGEFPEGEVMCDQSILQISPKLGLNAVRAHGKEAKTVFRRVAYYPPPSPIGQNENETTLTSTDGSDEHHNAFFTDSGQPWKQYKGFSIVRCFPLTGRTHQIRVHLQFLGHPIANDPIYANQRVWGPNLGKGRDSSDNHLRNDTNINDSLIQNHPDDETLISRLELMGKTHVAEAVAYHDELVDAYHSRKAERLNGEFCPICETPLYSDPGSHELGIYLHARRYECTDGKWAFESLWPEWAGSPPAGLEMAKAVVAEADGISVVDAE
jgi:tRNA pseudouridine32 synthase